MADGTAGNEAVSITKEIDKQFKAKRESLLGSLMRDQ